MRKIPKDEINYLKRNLELTPFVYNHKREETEDDITITSKMNVLKFIFALVFILPVLAVIQLTIHFFKLLLELFEDITSELKSVKREYEKGKIITRIKK